MNHDADRFRADYAHAVLGPHRLALVVAALGILVAVLRASLWPGLPRAIAVGLIATALGLMAIGTIRRIRMHRHYRGRR